MSFFLLHLLSQGLPPRETVTVGAPMVAYTLPDQHGKLHTFTSGTRWVLLSFEKRTGAMVKRWLKKKPAGYLEGLDFIVEISTLPEATARKIVLPKMRKYKYPVLIATDAQFREVYLMRTDRLTLFQLDPQGIVEAVFYVNDSETLETLVVGP